jgi:murein DD-endopeptidase MepM/ murein hydrolase activator NlpD
MRNLYIKTILCTALIFPAFAFEGPDNLPAPGLEAVLAAYPKDYFINPVDDALRLTGTFGELRPDHFHSGIDIKSKTGGVGQPVFAAADGYVDRIKVQAGGYGNVVYLKHPNGYSTVYAHLDRFASEIQDYVKEQQYKRERFEVDLQPADGLFRVKKGQEIGKLGNSGGSTGPHLHFEIRNTATQKVLNPQLFGLPVPDKENPEIRDMKVYFLNAEREVLDTRPFPIVRKSDGSYGVAGDTVRIGAWRVGFGVKTFDQMSGFRNDNGIFALTMLVDDQLAYEWRMDELDFDETRYMNAHVDYPARQRHGAWFHRCFLLPGNRLSNYQTNASQGMVALYSEKTVKITIKVLDPAGNETVANFWALRNDAAMETFATPPYQFELPYNSEGKIGLEDFALNMPKGALYEPLRLQYKTSSDESAGVYSSIHHVHNDRTPVHRYFDLGIRPFKLPEELRAKAVVARCGDGRPVNCGGDWNGPMLVTRTREFGDYCVMVDSEPPRITPVSFDNDLRRKNAMSFRIRDNFATGGNANGLFFRGMVDDRWVLFEYDRKSERITHVFDGHIGPGEHTLRLTVKDDRGNEAVFERAFVR